MRSTDAIAADPLERARTGSVRALVVDDSAFTCDLLKRILTDGGLDVVGSAFDAQSALKKTRALCPDVITLDLGLPGIGGLRLLRRIMEEHPTPVVVITGLSGRAAQDTVEALQWGAVDFALKYAVGEQIDPDRLRSEILEKTRLASRVRVVRSIPRAHLASPAERSTSSPVASLPPKAERSLAKRIVVVGASTGGPVAIRELLGRLPADFATPVLVVQHFPARFTRVLASQLRQGSAVRVREARDSDLPRPGLALIAPGDRHLLMREDGRLRLDGGPPVGGHRPSVDVTLCSVSEVYKDQSTAVLLTGMGNDGSKGACRVDSVGGTVLAQDEASCVVFGMPRMAVESGMAKLVGPPEKLARFLVERHGSCSPEEADPIARVQCETSRAPQGSAERFSSC